MAGEIIFCYLSCIKPLRELRIVVFAVRNFCYAQEKRVPKHSLENQAILLLLLFVR